MIQAGEIYFIPKGVVIGKVDYGRPCLVLRVSKHDATVCYFSTKTDNREPGQVAIWATDPDFKASGLRASSFIIDDFTEDVKLEFFHGAIFWGHANGQFKLDVEDWYGLPLI